MENELLTLIEEWEDPDENDGNWPYPTKHRVYRVGGELAERVRRAFDAEDGAEVTMYEDVISGGYSEYTQETEYDMTLEVESRTAQLPCSWSGGFTALIKWLDDKAPVEDA